MLYEVFIRSEKGGDTMPRLIIDSLNKRFGDVVALENMSLHVDPGEIYGFVGSNGAGKSTTMRIALGVLAADSGTVYFDDRKLDDSLRRRIGYMPEERGLYPKEPILEQLEYFAKLHGLGSQKARRNATALLEGLGLGQRLKDKLETLSLGNQQRVQLAASLVHTPEVLILDEPFSGLDPVAVQVMSEMLIDRAGQGVAVLFSSHQLDLVQRLCHRVGIITSGRMRAEGTVDELRASGRPLHEITTTARHWVPEQVEVVSAEGDHFVVHIPEGTSDQEVLRAALAHGEVHSFTRKIPDLTELFRKVVEQ